MSYFEDQEDAWFELGCPDGGPTEIDSDDIIDAALIQEERRRKGKAKNKRNEKTNKK